MSEDPLYKMNKLGDKLDELNTTLDKTNDKADKFTKRLAKENIELKKLALRMEHYLQPPLCPCCMKRMVCPSKVNTKGED